MFWNRDRDGLPDDKEVDTYLDLVTSDTEGDGDDSHGEWLRGTCPTDPTSKFAL